MLMLGEPDREMAPWKSPTDAGEVSKARMEVPPDELGEDDVGSGRHR